MSYGQKCIGFILIIDYGPAVTEHCLQCIGFPENVKVGKGFSVIEGQRASRTWMLHKSFKCLLLYWSSFLIKCSYYFCETDMDKLTSAIELAESLLKTLSEEPCQVDFFFYKNVHCHLFKPLSDVKKWFKNDFCFL